jgi:hypothetical protein
MALTMHIELAYSLTAQQDLHEYGTMIGPFVPFAPLELQAVHRRRAFLDETTWINISVLG